MIGIVDTTENPAPFASTKKPVMPPLRCEASSGSVTAKIIAYSA